MIRDIYIKGVAPDGTAVNSDATYTLAVPSGTKQPIPDTTYEIYVNGVLTTTTSLPTLATNILNINVV